MQFGSDDLAKYTFLPEAGDYIRTLGVSIADLTGPDFRKVVERAEERIVEAIRSGRVSDKTTNNRDIEIMSFPVSLMLARSTKLDHLMDRYALAEASRVESFLKQEKNGKIIEDIFQNFLGIELERSGVPYYPNFKINLSAYLKRAAHFQRPEWKLVNRIVQNGKVFVSQNDLIRLIREEIRELIMQRLKAVNVPGLPQDLDAIVKKLIEIAPPPRSAYTTINVSPDNYPPCVVESLRLLEKGENVPHYGRFLMATYLLAAGKSVDDIMALFPKSPDFKKSVTKYQVEHIAGLKGGHTRYTVPSCKTLQTHSFCFKDPVKCYEISSPLQYPSKKVRMSDSEADGTRRRGAASKGRKKSRGGGNGEKEKDEEEEGRRGWTKTRR